MTMKPTEVGLKVQARIRPAVGVVDTPEIKAKFLPGEIGAILDWEVRDTKTGLLIPGKSGIKKAESFTRQFFDLLMIKMADCGQYQTNGISEVRSTANVLEPSILNSPVVLATNALATDITFGPVVGRQVGPAAPTITDYALQSIVAHGVGANQLQYSIVTWGADASDATTSQFTLTRNFANASGGNVTVTEAGVYVKALQIAAGGFWYPAGYGAGVAKYFCIIRDVIAGGIIVGNGQTLTLNYRPQTVI